MKNQKSRRTRAVEKEQLAFICCFSGFWWARSPWVTSGILGVKLNFEERVVSWKWMYDFRRDLLCVQEDSTIQEDLMEIAKCGVCSINFPLEISHHSWWFQRARTWDALQNSRSHVVLTMDQFIQALLEWKTIRNLSERCSRRICSKIQLWQYSMAELMSHDFKFTVVLVTQGVFKLVST